MSQKILVTGGAGFIGSHLCERLLEEDYEVISLDNFNDFYNPEIKRENIRTVEQHPKADRFKNFEGDIRDQKLVLSLLDREKPEAIIHLAAMAGVRPSLGNPALYVDVNICGTQILLEACRANGIHHFIFGSSSSVYGNNPKVPFAETDHVDCPISPYAATKKAGELLAHTYAYLYPMRIFCLRFFTVYGPRQRPDLAIHKFARKILSQEEIPFFGDGSTQRDYTYVDDIIDGVMRALMCNLTPVCTSNFEIFNLGESRTISLNEMIHCLERALGMKARTNKLPMQPGDVVRTYADISKARKLLHYAPETQFETGIKKFVDWLHRKELVNAR